MAEEDFERALQVLLDGTALTVTTAGTDSGSSLDSLHVVSAISRVYRVALFGTDTSPDRPVASTWGHLDVRGEIGRGSSGSVYRAWDTRLAREVALKLLAADGAPRDAIEEGRLLARLNHPNIVRVFGADTHDGVPGLWMELLEGETLDDVLARDGVFGVEETLLIGLDLARALASVHAAGLLHRDIKARNVLRERGGRLVLMDLGAGRLQQEEPVFDATGTPMYMAPEVLAGAPATVGSDIYCLGVLLYRLLSGSYPVTGTGLGDLRRSHDHGHRRPLSAVRPDIHVSVVSAIERCCHARASERPTTTADVETVLTEALRDTLDARMVVLTPATRWMQRWRRTTIGAAVALASVVVLGWATWDTSLVRQTRRDLGLRVGPRSTLYLTLNGGLATVRDRRMSLTGYNPTTASVISASTDLGVRTTPGLPPWTLGGAFDLNGRPTAGPPLPAGICCFYDGTTDGRFNYAARADATLLEPIGSRALAPPALYQFDRDWSNPRMLFLLTPTGYYSGVSYAARTDTFWLVRHESGDSILEEWRQGGAAPVRSVTVAGENLTGVAVDPGDGTLWAINAQAAALALRLDNFDATGRHLGTLTIDRGVPDVLGSEGGAEFAWMPK